MIIRQTYDKKAYQLARGFLPSQKIPGVTEAIVAKYTNPFSSSSKPATKEDIYLRILESAQNANMKTGVIGGSIGGVEKLSQVLKSFHGKAIIDTYSDNWEGVLDDIVKQVGREAERGNS